MNCIVLFIAKQALFHSNLYAAVANLHDGDAAWCQIGVDDGLAVSADGRADLLAADAVDGDDCAVIQPRNGNLPAG